ncbi:MAG: tetratricopeptide repeat protein [Gammaproteobacteria bacterium]|nr:tetratricopeptide repeat protein [Gammaproteobacteria bacterium]
MLGKTVNTYRGKPRLRDVGFGIFGIAWFGILWLSQAAIASEADFNEQLVELQTRLELGEYAFAANEVSNQISDIRDVKGNYDRGLTPRYLLLGDAQMGLNEPVEAAESYTMALHVTRMNAGLNTPEQLDSLYKISDALQATGDFENANKAQERAYAIMLEDLGPNNPELLPSMLNLIKWYESNRRYSAAKILYIDAFTLAKKTIPPHDPRRVELARAFALGMRNTVFPPMSGIANFRGFSIQVPGYEEPLPFASTPSSYAMGLTALINVVDFVETHAAADLDLVTAAKLNLADWHQLFGKESKAIRMYREIWEALAPKREKRANIFDQPKLLYIRLPEFAEEDIEKAGVVKLLLTVSYRGRVTGRISQEVEPENNSIEFRTRVAARDARFRPAFQNGEPVTTRDFLLTHFYPLREQR